MITRYECIAIGCDRCGEPAEIGDVGTPHFESVGQARETFADWSIGADGSATCAGCLARAGCAERGHDWGLWRECACAGRIVAHAAEGCGQWRPCQRCGDWDERSAADVGGGAR